MTLSSLELKQINSWLPVIDRSTTRFTKTVIRRLKDPITQERTPIRGFNGDRYHWIWSNPLNIQGESAVASVELHMHPINALQDVEIGITALGYLVDSRKTWSKVYGSRTTQLDTTPHDKKELLGYLVNQLPVAWGEVHEAIPKLLDQRDQSTNKDILNHILLELGFARTLSGWVKNQP